MTFDMSPVMLVTLDLNGMDKPEPKELLTFFGYQTNFWFVLRARERRLQHQDGRGRTH